MIKKNKQYSLRKLVVKVPFSRSSSMQVLFARNSSTVMMLFSRNSSIVTYVTVYSNEGSMGLHDIWVLFMIFP